MGKPHGIGIVGLGNISGTYLDTLAGHPDVRIVAVADLDAERARDVAERLPGARAFSVDGAINHPEVETVLNLTIPAAHAEIYLLAIERGIDAYGEKPLAATVSDARAVMAAADAAGTRIGSAPDTVLGTGTQTARAAVDAGLIGRPISATATWVSSGHEHWHPNPDFYYLPGGGPMFDMGPYYVSSLVHILGPVVRVTGSASRSRDTRVIATGPRAGQVIPVEIDTHISGVLEHTGGALSTITMSFDAVQTSARPIEVHGETASLSVPDPNGFGGDVEVYRLGGDGWETLEPSAGFVDGSRGIGLLDFLAGGERASGALGLHVLDVMSALIDSAHSGRRIDISSSVERPPLVPLTPAATWRGTERLR